MNLLLRQENLDQLFSLMQTLSDLRSESQTGVEEATPSAFLPHPKAQILSRRVWDILMLLPTNPHIKKRLEDIQNATEEELRALLSPTSPQKLLYTFYIVDWLGRPARLRRHSGLQQEQQQPQQTWMQHFIEAGGLRHLFEIFVSGQLQDSRQRAGKSAIFHRIPTVRS